MTIQDELTERLELLDPAFADEIVACIIEAGYAIVPVEPTEAMRSKGQKVRNALLGEANPPGGCPSYSIYRAMIAAA